MASAYEVSGAMFDVTYFAGMAVSAMVTLRRGQEVIRRRVDARGGRPVSDAYAKTVLVWCVLKTMIWPLNLAVWLVLGRPGPGSYAYVRPSAGTTRTEPAHLATSSTARSDDDPVTMPIRIPASTLAESHRRPARPGFRL